LREQRKEQEILKLTLKLLKFKSWSERKCRTHHAGRPCKKWSWKTWKNVTVTKLKEIQLFSHVIHMVAK
jgi:hypothetical protein